VRGAVEEELGGVEALLAMALGFHSGGHDRVIGGELGRVWGIVVVMQASTT
jgi:hypothetical protein